MEKMVLICLSFFVINFAISFFYNHFEEIALNHRTKEKSEKELMNWDFSSENLIFYTTQLIFFISSFFCLYAISKYLVNTL